MAEYIEREAVMQGLGKFFSPVNTVEQALMLNHALKVINWFPAADVAPVVHGRWETVPNREFDGFETVIRGEAERCTNCCRASKDFKKWFEICPNCGAKMDCDSK